MEFFFFLVEKIPLESSKLSILLRRVNSSDRQCPRRFGEVEASITACWVDKRLWQLDRWVNDHGSGQWCTRAWRRLVWTASAFAILSRFSGLFFAMSLISMAACFCSSIEHDWMSETSCWINSSEFFNAQAMTSCRLCEEVVGNSPDLSPVTFPETVKLSIKANKNSESQVFFSHST